MPSCMIRLKREVNPRAFMLREESFVQGLGCAYVHLGGTVTLIEQMRDGQSCQNHACACAYNIAVMPGCFY